MCYRYLDRQPGENAMITAVVRFKLPQGTTLADAKAAFERSAPIFRGAPGLIRKYFLYDDGPTGGGVYLWESREAAERMYNDAFKKRIADNYGTVPQIDYYETPVIVDNQLAEKAA
jgi:hypothetical protein